VRKAHAGNNLIRFDGDIE